MKQRNGFTLIELLMVFAVIALFASVVLVSLQGSRGKASIAAAQQFDSQLRSTLGAYIFGNWRFEEGSGSVVYDESGNKYDGSINGGVLYGANDAFLSTALSFNGTDSSVQMPAMSAKLPLIIVFWAKPITNSPVGMFDTAPNVVDTLRNYGSGYVEWQNGCGVPINVTANKWVHLAFVFRHDGINRIIEWYKDGKAQTGCSAPASNSFAWTSLRLGDVNLGSDGRYEGSLDNFAVYNSTFTVSQIQKL